MWPSTVREIVLDASVYEQKAVTIIELMGRHAGWLTAAVFWQEKRKTDNPVLIYLPESNFDLENLPGIWSRLWKREIASLSVYQREFPI